MPQGIIGKVCVECKRWKGISHFYKNPPNQHAEYKARCRPCESDRLKTYNSDPVRKAQRKAYVLANREKCEANKAKWRKSSRGRESHRKAKLRRRFGLTVEQYDAMLKAQDGVCAICEKPETRKDKRTATGFTRLAVDHCHVTGKVRQLLCASCNRRVGEVEQAEMHCKILAYIAKHK